MAKNLESPNFPIGRPGQPALQAMAEALDRSERHDQWHRDHPGEFNCPPELSPAGDYELIQNGQNLFGAMTFEAGDAFVPRGRK